MSLSDLLDGAFKLLRADAGTIVLITLALFGPLQLLAAWAQRDTLDFFGMLLDPGSAPDAVGRGFGDPLIGMLAGLAQFLVLPFVTGAVARVVGGSYLGETIPVGTALKAALGRWWSLFSAWILVHLAEFAGVLVGFALLVTGAVVGGGVGGGAALVVGVILVLLGFVGAVFVMPFFVAVAPAIVLEDLGAVGAMRRSAGLMRPRYWPYLGTAVLTGLLATVVSYALMAVPMGLAFAVGSGAWLLLAVGSVLANVVALPFVAIVATLMYFDGRIRTEAFDLTVVADELARPSRVRRVSHGVPAAPMALPAYDVDPDRIGSVVREVLDRPEFHQPEPGLLERLQRAALEALADILGGILTDGSADLIGWAIAVLAVVALVVLTVRFLRGTRARGAPGDGDVTAAHRPRAPTEWLEEAKQHVRAGRLREASRCRYRALVAELERRGLIEDRPGRTVGEETGALRRRRPAVAVPFADAAEVFQRAWYGPEDPYRADLERLSHLCDRVLEVAR
ncbi:MAG: DUF4129 domain-containing protein [Actinobacteria bacterium]|nr:DUF4129 domain-containing protein [Actinomycetota bacterium]